jgi:hypothetical protein
VRQWEMQQLLGMIKALNSEGSSDTLEQIYEVCRKRLLALERNCCPVCGQTADESKPDRVHTIGDDFVCHDYSITIW